LLELDEELVARAAVRVGKSLAELHRLAARAGKARIYGEYVARGSSKTGTFLVDAGLLSVGVGLSGREKKVRIFGPRKWFRERTGWEP
jgi:Xaa-Pro aminopeptidase